MRYYKNSIKVYSYPSYTIRRLPFQFIVKFNLNLRNSLSKSSWEELSKKVRENSNYTCAYCQKQFSPSETDCHEEWYYSPAGIIYLKKLKCVCKECHRTAHPGAAIKFHQTSIKEILDHYIKINGISEEVVIKELKFSKDMRDRLLLSEPNWKLEDGLIERVEEEVGIKLFKKIDIIEF